MKLYDWFTVCMTALKDLFSMNRFTSDWMGSSPPHCSSFSQGSFKSTLQFYITLSTNFAPASGPLPLAVCFLSFTHVEQLLLLTISVSFQAVYHIKNWAPSNYHPPAATQECWIVWETHKESNPHPFYNSVNSILVCFSHYPKTCTLAFLEALNYWGVMDCWPIQVVSPPRTWRPIQIKWWVENIPGGKQIQWTRQ